jgi:hypothetical protein
MAIVKGIFQATGSIKGVSFYSPVGSDKVIMRTKGGATKERIAKGKEFEKLRHHQAEWGGCVQFARGVRGAVGELYRLADFNLSPVWTGMGKKLIKLDTISPIGERKLQLTVYKQALNDFNFNRNYPLASILRVMPTVEVDRQALKATVVFPRINTESHLVNFQRLPYFRLIACLGTVSDMHYKPVMQTNYDALNPELQGFSVSKMSNWLSTNDIIDEQTFIMQFDDHFIPMITDDITLVVSVGMEFGNVAFGGSIVEVKRAGCARILKVL